MSCVHAESTTILWAYGEADETHLSHVQECAECQAVVAIHAEVGTALGPAMASVALAPRPRIRRGWLGGAVALGLAAAAGWVWMARAPLPPPMGEPDIAAIAVSVAGERGDAFDFELDALDRELDALSRDMEML